MFPLNKKIIYTNNKTDSFLKKYENISEIPLLPHPGAFSKKRTSHIHEGVDLYCENNDPVFSMRDGIILDIIKFTGEHAGSPWWNNTWSIFVDHYDFILNYGELTPNENIAIGKTVKEGELIGNIKTVLLKNKGRPMSMLHLEMYKKNTKSPIKEWRLDEEKNLNLLDPTDLLKNYISR